MSIQSKLEMEKQSMAETLKTVEKKLNDEKSMGSFVGMAYTRFQTNKLIFKTIR